MLLFLCIAGALAGQRLASRDYVDSNFVMNVEFDASDYVKKNDFSGDIDNIVYDGEGENKVMKRRDIDEMVVRVDDKGAEMEKIATLKINGSSDIVYDKGKVDSLLNKKIDGDSVITKVSNELDSQSALKAKLETLITNKLSNSGLPTDETVSALSTRVTTVEGNVETLSNNFGNLGNTYATKKKNVNGDDYDVVYGNELTNYRSLTNRDIVVGEKTETLAVQSDIPTDTVSTSDLESKLNDYATSTHKHDDLYRNKTDLSYTNDGKADNIALVSEIPDKIVDVIKNNEEVKSEMKNVMDIDVFEEKYYANGFEIKGEMTEIKRRTDGKKGYITSLVSKGTDGGDGDFLFHFIENNIPDNCEFGNVEGNDDNRHFYAYLDLWFDDKELFPDELLLCIAEPSLDSGIYCSSQNSSASFNFQAIRIIARS